MTGKKPKNVAASVRERLTNVAKKSGESFQYILTRYAIERLLYRLSQSSHGAHFILKGAMLFQVWRQSTHRTTRDLDLLGEGTPSIERLVAIFKDVASVEVDDDGLSFPTDEIQGEQIKEEDEYQGIRIRGLARLGSARIPLQIDIGFGDAVTPEPERISYPTLLDAPAPQLLAYNRETVVAEKFQAMVLLGMTNSRMKDFFDLWCLARDFAFDGAKLADAIGATFRRRDTTLPDDMPVALSEEFARDATKQTQWNAFLKKANVGETVELDDVLTLLREFLLSPTRAIASQKAFKLHWTARGPWRPQG
jgi:predicted nucleotidyltransferase component of viral defense system